MFLLRCIFLSLLLLLTTCTDSAEARQSARSSQSPKILPELCKILRRELNCLKECVPMRIFLQENLRGKVILIDAGHGGKDSGACRLGIREKDITLRLALQLKAVFEQRGAKVFLTRDSDKVNLELETICQIVDTRKPDVFISLHVNSSPGAETKTSGLQTYYRTDASRMLAHTVHSTIIKRGVCADRGIQDCGFWVLRSERTPSILIETGYINCRFDRKRLLDSRFRAKLCDGIADGVAKYWRKKGVLRSSWTGRFLRQMNTCASRARIFRGGKL